MPPPVTFDRRFDARLQTIADRAAAAGEDVDTSLALLADLTDVPMPGSGATAGRFEMLATLAVGDLTPARIAEAHLDALAILAEARAAGVLTDSAGVPTDLHTWGVFAAEGPGTRLTATEETAGWRLTGVKPWCSLAGSLDAALVTAHTDQGRRLFAAGLRQPGVSVSTGTWHARGLTAVPSGPVGFDSVPAVPIGPAGWYLKRPGFSWGGVGVAAVWWGGAIGLARALYARCRATPDQPILLMQLGAVDTVLNACREVLLGAAEEIDTGKDVQLSVARVRTLVHDAAENVLRRVGHVLGPAPMAMDAAHARRVADLTLYLRQHHAERDEAAQGARLAASDDPPW